MANNVEGWTSVSVATEKGEKTIFTKPELFLGAIQALVSLLHDVDVSSLVGWHFREGEICRTARLFWRIGQNDIRVACDICGELFSFPQEVSSLEELQEWAEGTVRLAQVRAAHDDAIREECAMGGGGLG